MNFYSSFCLWWGNNFSLSIYSNKTAFAQSSDQQNFKCVNNICEIQSPTRSSELDGEIPSEYIKAGPRSNDYYYVSSLSLPWPQAQYECQSKNGRLAELGMHEIDITHMVCKYNSETLKLLIFPLPDDRSRFDQKLVTLLKSSRSEDETKNNTQLRFWVGASDLGERGTFVWYSSDNKNVSDNNWALNGRADKDTHVQYDDYAADKDQRCLQINTNGKWNAFSCEFESRFVCQFSPASNRYIFQNFI